MPTSTEPDSGKVFIEVPSQRSYQGWNVPFINHTASIMWTMATLRRFTNRHYIVKYVECRYVPLSVEVSSRPMVHIYRWHTLESYRALVQLYSIKRPCPSVPSHQSKFTTYMSVGLAASLFQPGMPEPVSRYPLPLPAGMLDACVFVSPWIRTKLQLSLPMDHAGGRSLC